MVERKQIVLEGWDCGNPAHSHFSERAAQKCQDKKHAHLKKERIWQDMKLGKLVRQKFRSGNEISIDRITIKRDEFDEVVRG